MNETPKASFSFDTYEINRFSFSSPSNLTEGLIVDFNPSGLIFVAERKFQLDLTFIAQTEATDKEEVIHCELKAYFSFNVDGEFLVPDYFYRNSIAIVYPYLRAFISVLTSQAQVKHLILPVLNLSSLEKKLKDNTREFQTAIQKLD